MYKITIPSAFIVFGILWYLFGEELLRETPKENEINSHSSVTPKENNHTTDINRFKIQKSDVVNELQPGVANEKTETSPQKIQISQERINHLLDSSIDMKNDVITLDNLSEVLNIANFNHVIDTIAQQQALNEIEREQTVYQAILDDNTINRYPFDVACGKGLCAINVKDVMQSEIDQVKQAISNELGLGSHFFSTVKEGANSNIRVMSQSSPTDSIKVSSDKITLG